MALCKKCATEIWWDKDEKTGGYIPRDNKNEDHRTKCIPNPAYIAKREAILNQKPKIEPIQIGEDEFLK